MNHSEYIKIKEVDAWYSRNHALKNVSMDIPQNSIYSFIGPSGCGKTTLLRSINRLNDLIPEFRLEGDVQIDGQSAYTKDDKKFVEHLRKGIGMVFQQPNPLPMSIIQNMIMPLREHFHLSELQLKDIAIEKLIMSGLYEEVKDRLNKTAFSLSGGQQQRLCIARALMLEPKVLLFDEPCSALDPISTYIIEDMLLKLKEKYTIIIVTHNMEQASRISDYTAFFYQGQVLECGKVEDIFVNPKNDILKNYISGRI